MRTPIFLTIACCTAVLAASPASAQVTYGKKPQLPAPFTTKSAGNGPSESRPPAGFLPSVPAGFHINIFAKDFKQPRFLAVAPMAIFFLPIQVGEKSLFSAIRSAPAGTAAGGFRPRIEPAFWDRLSRGLRLHRQHRRSGALSLRQADLQTARRCRTHPRPADGRRTLHAHAGVQQGRQDLYVSVVPPPTSTSRRTSGVPRSWCAIRTGRTRAFSLAACAMPSAWRSSR